MVYYDINVKEKKKTKPTEINSGFSISAATCLVPRHIYVKPGAFVFANSIVVWFSEVRPEFLMLITVPREVEHALVEEKCYVYNSISNNIDVSVSRYNRKHTLGRLQNSTGPLDRDEHPSQLSTPWEDETRWTYRRFRWCICLTVRSAPKLPFQSIFLLCVSSRYGHVVKHTETVGGTAHAVVSWRSVNNGKQVGF